MVNANDLGINLWFFIKFSYVMLLCSNSVWKQYNTDYTLTLSNVQTKIFYRVGEENEGQKLLDFILFVWIRGGGEVVVWHCYLWLEWPLVILADFSLVILFLLLLLIYFYLQESLSGSTNVFSWWKSEDLLQVKPIITV